MTGGYPPLDNSEEEEANARPYHGASAPRYPAEKQDHVSRGEMQVHEHVAHV